MKFKFFAPRHNMELDSHKNRIFHVVPIKPDIYEDEGNPFVIPSIFKESIFEE